MKASTITKRLAALVATKKVQKNCSAYRLILQACETGRAVIRPCWTSGAGRFCSNLDYTADVCRLLDALRVQYVQGNDAPRGGLPGNFIQIKHLEA